MNYLMYLNTFLSRTTYTIPLDDGSGIYTIRFGVDNAGYAWKLDRNHKKTFNEYLESGQYGARSF